MNDIHIAVIGLGYVGLPLALAFAEHFNVVGYDTNATRISELNEGNDITKEADENALQKLLHQHNETKRLRFTSNTNDIKNANIYIITVPTPVSRFNTPDLQYLLEATTTIGKLLKKDDIVIYESTVYPGCTEEDCVPLLEAASALVFNKDFFVGYSPERINPGDKINTLITIKKVTSGSTPAIADKVDALYKKIIIAGTHKASSIKVAEASKAIENAQRDVNISFVNELALIFDKMNIDTHEVLEAAGTKWNFLKFTPGLVGGHCISVDPYYLAHKAEMLGYHPQVILSGRQVNDYMGEFIADKVIKLMISKEHKIKGARALILGITFKENCTDVRNTKVVDIYNALLQFGLQVDVYDPWANATAVLHEFGITLYNNEINLQDYAAIILAVAHQQFFELDFTKCKNNNCVVFDAKAILPKEYVDARL